MTAILSVLLLAWLTWIALNFLAMAACSLLGEPTSAQFDGFRIRIPAWLHTALTERELEAFRQHEEGHRAHWHVWKNFARVCFFIPLTARARRMQECEADDYCDDPAALASAIRKTSNHPFDLQRALLLEACAPFLAKSQHPHARDGRNTKEARSI